ncbi:MAG: hypothetical protein PHW96_02150 [Candidatus Nanoarchaeia archaeon]|nr:hypothetical protein [Candidatus Nanoarchaeia archaeon]
MLKRFLPTFFITLLAVSAVCAGEDCIEQITDSCEGYDSCYCEIISESQMCERTVCDVYETYSCGCEYYTYQCNPHNPRQEIIGYAGVGCEKQRCTEWAVRKETVCDNPYYSGCVVWTYNDCVKYETYYGTCQGAPIYAVVYDYDTCSGFRNCALCSTGNCIEAHAEVYECSEAVQQCKATLCTNHPEPRIADVKYENSKLEFDVYNILHGNTAYFRISINGDEINLKTDYEPYHVSYIIENYNVVPVYIYDKIDLDEYYDEIVVGESGEVHGEFVYYPFIPRDVPPSQIPIPQRYSDFIGFGLIGVGAVAGTYYLVNQRKKKESLINDIIQGLSGTPNGSSISENISNFKIAFGLGSITSRAIDFGDGILDGIEHILNLIFGFGELIKQNLEGARDRFLRSFISGLAAIPVIGAFTGFDTLQAILKNIPEEFGTIFLKKIMYLDLWFDEAEVFFKKIIKHGYDVAQKISEILGHSVKLSKIRNFMDSIGEKNFFKMLKEFDAGDMKKVVEMDVAFDLSKGNMDNNIQFFTGMKNKFNEIFEVFHGNLGNIKKIEFDNLEKGILGNYNFDNKILKIDINKIGSFEEFYELVTHEIIHSAKVSGNVKIGDMIIKSVDDYEAIFKNYLGHLEGHYKSGDFNSLYNQFMDTAVNKLAMTKKGVDIDVWYKGWMRNYEGEIMDLSKTVDDTLFFKKYVKDIISDKKELLPKLMEMRIVFENHGNAKFVDTINKIIDNLGELSSEANIIKEAYESIYNSVRWVD